MHAESRISTCRCGSRSRVRHHPRYFGQAHKERHDPSRIGTQKRYRPSYPIETRDRQLQSFNKVLEACGEGTGCKINRKIGLIIGVTEKATIFKAAFPSKISAKTIPCSRYEKLSSRSSLQQLPCHRGRRPNRRREPNQQEEG